MLLCCWKSMLGKANTQRIVLKSIISIIVFTSMFSSSCGNQTANPFSPTDRDDFFFFNYIVLPPQYPRETWEQSWKSLLWEDSGSSCGWCYPRYLPMLSLPSEACRVQSCLPDGNGDKEPIFRSIWQAFIFTESQNPFDWKRHLRSLSPTYYYVALTCQECCGRENMKKKLCFHRNWWPRH